MPSTLTADQIANIARSGGFPEKEINTAVGVAMAESGGNPSAHNSKPPDDSYGLWQINMLGAMGQQRLKEFGITKKEQLFDPYINAKAAYTVWKGSGWNAWTTYTSGKYKGGLPNVDLSGVTSVVTDPLTTAASAIKAPILGVADSLNGLGKNILKSGVNAAGIMGGILFIMIGFIALIYMNGGKKHIKTAAQAAVMVAK